MKNRFGLQNIDTKISQLLKPLFQGNKRKFAIINSLVKNWNDIVGEKSAAQCQPSSLNFDSEGKNGKLTISANNSAIAFFLKNNQEIILERIASIYGFKGINKLIIKQEPKISENYPEKLAKLDQKSEDFLEQKISQIEDENLAKTLLALGREVIRKN